MISLRPSLSVLLSSAALAVATKAVAVSFTFAGTTASISDTGNLIPGMFSLGAPMTGSLFYDPGMAGPDGQPAVGTGNYGFTGANAGGFVFSFESNGVTVSSTLTVSAPFNTVTVVNGESSDRISYIAQPTAFTGGSIPAALTSSYASLELYDLSATAFSGDDLPDFAPTIDLFPNTRRLSFLTTDGNGTWSEVRFNIDTLTPVPEPGEWAAIAGGGLAAFAAIRRRRLGLVRGGGR